MPLLTPRAEKLILDFEVGGGQAYYDRRLVHPTWPGGESGVTIGVGYDIGYTTRALLDADWGSRVAGPELARLARCVGVKALPARALIPSVRDIAIPWMAASAVFFAVTVPRYYRQAADAFPGLESLPADAQGALVSLVFNRGGSMRGNSRSEMRTIRDLVPRGDLRGIAAQLRSMKRLWVGRGLDGLITRREEEARLVESAIAPTVASPVAAAVASPIGAAVAAPIGAAMGAPIDPLLAAFR